MDGKPRASMTFKGRLTVRLMLFSFMTLVVIVLVNLLESSIRITTSKAVSLKMKSGFSHMLDLYLTNSTIFKTNILFGSSDVAYSKSSFDEKQITRSNPETSMASSNLQHLPLSVTAYRKDTFADLNLTRTETSTKEIITIESRMKNVHRGRNEMPHNKNERQRECDNCFKHDFEYYIQNDHICDTSSMHENIDLLILVTTVHKNGFVREALRTTWLSCTKNNTANVRHVFLLGKTFDNRLQESVMRENDIHHDIVQEMFIDTYQNLTYKTIMGFKWASTKCSNAHFVMKTDDDMWVNVPALVKLLSGTDLENYLQTGLTGNCRAKESPIRNKNFKWYASLLSYPDVSYPPFCSGTGYLTSIKVASEIYHVSPNVPFFHLEDIYVALCARRLGLSVKKTVGFYAGRRLNVCDYKKDDVLTIHHVTPSKLTEIWNTLCSLK
ncbi:beta-1,3-galactosyltransferase 1-like [Dreissena polymorpha]|nr:beta-1,3-galactosyltransferase 1-like [Dreissena polymorpha]XP_052266575.1 beta-1,3-galactosyltransferase 1-like [Dreissena polymorpha]